MGLPLATLPKGFSNSVGKCNESKKQPALFAGRKTGMAFSEKFRPDWGTNGFEL